MATSPRGRRFQALAQLVNFDGRAGQRQSLTATEAVLLDQSAKLGVTVQGRPAHASASGDHREGDVLARPGKLQADLLNLLDQVTFSHEAWSRAMRRSRRSIRRR